MWHVFVIHLLDFDVFFVTFHLVDFVVFLVLFEICDFWVSVTRGYTYGVVPKRHTHECHAVGLEYLSPVCASFWTTYLETSI